MAGVWVYTLVPVAGMGIGAAITTLRKPGPKLTSALQHFAAGVVFAAAAAEILPDLKQEGAAMPLILGGMIGVAAMIMIKILGENWPGSAGFIVMIATDVVVDGLVLGIGFAAGPQQGLLLTIALTLEVLFLGVAMALRLGEGTRTPFQVIAVTMAIALLLPLAALAGGPISTLPPPVVIGFFSFGLVALLYLVTEELLVEAHEVAETPIITAMFFVGFLALIALEETL